MNKLFLMVFLITACANSEKDKKQSEVDFEYVINKYKERSEKIEKIGYNAHRIDTFPDGTVWNNKGEVLIVKDEKDSVFGFSFYGRRYDFPKEYIYMKMEGLLKFPQ